jgi:carboxyl-terminal processing protease
MKRHLIRLTFLLALSAGVGFGIGSTVFDSRAAEKPAGTYRMLEMFGEVFERVRNDYVEEVSDERLIEAAIEGMLVNLDPHSTFLSRRKYKDMQVQTKGEFGGLGIEVTMEKGFVKVVSPIDETPAAKAGLQPGDFITHLDGAAVLGMTLSEAVEKMRGLVNTDIVLTIRRGAAKGFDVTITRDKIRIRTIRSRTEGNIGYVRITSFSEQTDRGLKKAVDKIKSKLGKNLIGYVIDLRNNPGGLLSQAVSVSDSFLDQGEIVSTRGRKSGKDEPGQRFQASAGDLTDGKPLVVLINGGSASASEIVAGALQDHRRAVLLGTRTFGKGSVQTIIPLSQKAAIKLTTQRYYTPSGHSIQAKGIEPDILVRPARVEVLENGGPRRSERDLRRALKNEEDKSSKPTDKKPKKDPKADKGKKDKKDKKDSKGPAKAEKDKEKPQDYQLARALDLLRGIALFGNRMVN